MALLRNTYLRCNGSVAIFRESGIEFAGKQEIAAHLMGARINFSGNDFLKGTDIQNADSLRTTSISIASHARPVQWTFNAKDLHRRLTQATISTRSWLGARSGPSPAISHCTTTG